MTDIAPTARSYEGANLVDEFPACNREALAVQLNLPSRPSFGTQFPISSR